MVYACNVCEEILDHILFHTAGFEIYNGCFMFYPVKLFLLWKGCTKKDFQIVAIMISYNSLTLGGPMSDFFLTINYVSTSRLNHCKVPCML